MTTFIDKCTSLADSYKLNVEQLSDHSVKFSAGDKFFKITPEVLPGDTCELELSSGFFIEHADYMNKQLKAKPIYAGLKKFINIRIRGPALKLLVEEKAFEILDLPSIYDKFIAKCPDLKKTPLWSRLDGYIRFYINTALNSQTDILPPQYNPTFELYDNIYRLDCRPQGLFEEPEGNLVNIRKLTPELNKAAQRVQEFFCSKKFENKINKLKKFYQLDPNFEVFVIGSPLNYIERKEIVQEGPALAAYAGKRAESHIASRPVSEFTRSAEDHQTKSSQTKDVRLGSEKKSQASTKVKSQLLPLIGTVKRSQKSDSSDSESSDSESSVVQAKKQKQKAPPAAAAAVQVKGKSLTSAQTTATMTRALLQEAEANKKTKSSPTRVSKAVLNRKISKSMQKKSS